MMSPFITCLADDANLECAYLWACRRRAHAGNNHAIWQVRFHWAELKSKLQQQLIKGTYQFSPLKQYQINIVLKAITLVLTQYLKPSLSRHCFHLAGHGGLKTAVRTVHRQLPQYPFFLRSDVKSYYASINHFILFGQLAKLINDNAILRLLWQYLRHLRDIDGDLYENTQGISLGCPLSPLMAAIYLQPLEMPWQSCPCNIVVIWTIGACSLRRVGICAELLKPCMPYSMGSIWSFIQIKRKWVGRRRDLIFWAITLALILSHPHLKPGKIF